VIELLLRSSAEISVTPKKWKEGKKGGREERKKEERERTSSGPAHLPSEIIKCSLSVDLAQGWRTQRMTITASQ
jgi:hypothetical protein